MSILQRDIDWGVVILTVLLILFGIVLGSGIKDVYDQEEVRRSECEDAGGYYQEVYRSDDICFVDGKVFKVYK